MSTAETFQLQFPGDTVSHASFQTTKHQVQNLNGWSSLAVKLENNNINFQVSSQQEDSSGNANWFNEQCNTNAIAQLSNWYFGQAPTALNFAFCGTLTISSPATGNANLEIPNLYIAQGQFNKNGQQVNNWWVGYPTGVVTGETQSPYLVLVVSNYTIRLTPSVNSYNSFDVSITYTMPLLKNAENFYRAISETPKQNKNQQKYNAYSYCYVDTQTNGSGPRLENTDETTYPDGITLEEGQYPIPQNRGPWAELVPGVAPYIGITTELNQAYALTDCSGFVAYIINTAAPAAFKNLPRNKELDHVPTASQYVTLPNILPGDWAYVTDADYGRVGIHNAQGGDILAWKTSNDLCDGGTDNDKSNVNSDGDDTDDTGHVMILSGSVSTEQDYFIVGVYDASDRVHEVDSRSGFDHTGVGLGYIGLKQDANGGWCVNFNPKGDDNWYKNAQGTIAIIRLIG